MSGENIGAQWIRRQKAILRAAVADKLKRGPMAMLRVLLDCEDGRRQTARIAREKLAEKMGCNIKTVDENIAALVRLGAVEKIYCSGGRGKANVYKITIKPLYLSENGEPLPRDGENLPEKVSKHTRFSPETYPKNGEPSSSSFHSERRDGGASRAGRNVGTLDAGAGPGPRPGPTRTPEEQALFVADLRTMQFGEALEREKARKRASAGELP